MHSSYTIDYEVYSKQKLKQLKIFQLISEDQDYLSTLMCTLVSKINAYKASDLTIVHTCPGPP